jgi:pyruvate carboxylase
MTAPATMQWGHRPRAGDEAMRWGYHPLAGESGAK